MSFENVAHHAHYWEAVGRRFVEVNEMVISPVSVDPTELDPALLDRLLKLPRRVVHADRRYPDLTDIYAALGVDEPTSLAPTAYVAAQRAWFAHGSSGCVFAGLAALQSAEIGWRYVVVPETSPVAPSTARRIDDLVDEAAADPSVNIVSLVFPAIASEPGLIELIDRLLMYTSFSLERQHVYGDRLVLYVRRTVAEKVRAWVMAFAPFASMPTTRRAPFVELAVRVKPKLGPLYDRLTDDRAAAHLADIPLTMPSVHWEHRWTTTLKKTRQLLGHEPNELSAARATISVPLNFVPAQRLVGLVQAAG